MKITIKPDGNAEIKLVLPEFFLRALEYGSLEPESLEISNPEYDEESGRVIQNVKCTFKGDNPYINWEYMKALGYLTQIFSDEV